MSDITVSEARRLVYEAYELKIGIDLDDPEHEALVIEELPPGSFSVRQADDPIDRHYRLGWLPAADSNAARDGYHLFVDGEEQGSFADVSVAIERLESSLQIYVAEFARPYLFLHAGVVKWNGLTIVLPGKSFAGKSTMVRGLVHDGGTYFSDEFAVLDHNGRVRPYARKLSQRSGPFGPAGRINLDAHTPREDELLEPVRVDIVALMQYDVDSTWEATKLTGGEAVIAISENMVPIRLRPADTLQMLVNLVESAQVYRCIRPDFESAQTWLASFVQ